MTRDEVLQEIQRRISEHKGYRLEPSHRRLLGSLDPSSAPYAFVPRWPQDWCDVRALVEEMKEAGAEVQIGATTQGACAWLWLPGHRMVIGHAYDHAGFGRDEAEAIARCYCAWKGIDLSDFMELSDGRA